jgi:hypothetical protein
MGNRSGFPFKFMKKIIALSLITGIFFQSSAHSKFGIFAGPQLSTSRYLIEGTKQPTSGKPGFQLGATYLIPVEGKLYFAPAIFYSLKGYKVKFNKQAFPPDTAAIDNNTTIHTVELAALLQYNFSSKENHFFVKAGPSLDFQLFGKEKFTKKNNTTVDRSMVFNFTHYGHYGASFLFQFGYTTNSGITIFSQYTHGLGNLNNADGGPFIRHRVYGISIGKLF